MKEEKKQDRETGFADNTAAVQGKQREETGHTPGPWKRIGTFVYALTDSIDSYKNGLPIQINRFSAKIVHDNSGSTEATAEEMEANARLIAAAPELLEACKDSLSYFKAILEISAFVEVCRTRDNPAVTWPNACNSSTATKSAGMI